MIDGQRLGLMSENLPQYPHITVSCAKNVGPKLSNDLIKRYMCVKLVGIYARSHVRTYA